MPDPMSEELGPLVDALPGLVWCASPDGRVELLNRRFREYTGSDADLEAAIHPADLPGWLERWRPSPASDQPWDLELRLRRFDGSWRWFLCRACPIKDASGLIIRWCGVNTDIDDRRRAEDHLRAVEKTFSGWVESYPGLMVTMSLTGQVELFSREILDYFGKSPEELRSWAMTDAVHPDDLPRAIAAWTANINGGTAWTVEHRCRRADGVYRWFLVRTSPVRDKEARITGWYVVLTDIDDLKRTEAELRLSEAFLLEGQRLARVGNFAWDVEEGAIVWSEEIHRIYELEPASPVTLDRIGTRVHPEDIPMMADMVERARRGVGHFEYQHRVVMPDGRIKYVHLIAHRTYGKEDRLEYIGAVQDVTERRLSEAALNRARSELAHVSRVSTLSSLTTSIAHEVNQPLASIVTNGHACLRWLNRETPELDEARASIERILRDGNRAAAVIQRLRALFRKRQFTPESVDLNEAAREVIALSLGDLQRDGVVLLSELAADLPLVVGDRVQLQQVILNLLRNASDAMAGVVDRPRQLLLRTERENGDHVRLTVRDAGTGIDGEDTEKLFEPFQTTKSTGMGIGLSVSRSIIESHRGRIWAAPNEGPGATFAFSIPVGPKHATDSRGGASAGSSPEPRARWP
jgi:PAS domain S-box-containing protein